MYQIFYAIRLKSLNPHPVIAHCMIVSYLVHPEMEFKCKPNLSLDYGKAVARFCRGVSNLGCYLMEDMRYTFYDNEVWPWIDHTVKMFTFEMVNTSFEILMHLDFLRGTKRGRWFYTQLGKLAPGYKDLLKYIGELIGADKRLLACF